jgi:hypothetical protein
MDQQAGRCWSATFRAERSCPANARCLTCCNGQGAVDGAPPLGKGELERFVERSSFEQGPTGRQRRVAVAAPPDRLDRLAEHIDLDL